MERKLEKGKTRIVITGGHHTPALAVAEALKKRGRFAFYWLGWTAPAEYQAVKKLGIPLFRLPAGKLYRSLSLNEILRLPLGLVWAFYLLIRVRPKLILSFGGYLAAPVVLVGFLLRIPAVTHEQTVVSGWSNRFISFFCEKVFISWEGSAKFFPREKTVFTGNPVRRSVFEKKTKRFRFPERLPTIYITGGRQGAHLINKTVRQALSEFLRSYNIIHQTGSLALYQDYQKLMILRRQLPPKLSRRYIVQEYFGEDEIGAVFGAADLVVSRAGANIVTELAALGKPAILIPIPWVSHNEQLKNAKLLEGIGLASILSQEELSPDTLFKKIAEMIADLDLHKVGGRGAKRLINLSAADQIAGEIVKMIK